MTGKRDDLPPESKPTLLEQQPATDLSILEVITDALGFDKHYAAIGKVAASWAYFEAVVDTWLAYFADLPTEVAICFTAQMLGPRPRIDAFIALVRHLGAHKRWNEPLETFAKEITGLSEQRNRAVHDVWVFEPHGPHRHEVTARRMVRNVKIHVPTEELLALARNIDRISMRFEGEFASPIFSELRTLPGISPREPGR